MAEIIAESDLLEMRDSVVTALKAALLNPKPSYELDGQQVSWTEYRKSLQESLDYVTLKLREYYGRETVAWEETRVA